MIDPGYIPEDLSQYLLNYPGSQEEHESCDNAQSHKVDSSDHESVFIPPYVSTPKEHTTPTQEDQESFQDSGMSEDESDGDLSPLQSSKTSSLENQQDTTSISGKSKDKKVEFIEENTFKVSSEDTQGSKASSKTPKKRPLLSDKAKDNSPLHQSGKKRKANGDSDEMNSTSKGVLNQDTQNPLAIEILGDVSSSEEESDADGNSFFSQSKDTKNQRNKKTSKNLQATADGSDENHLQSISSADTKELSRKATSITVDSSSSGETDSHSCVTSRKKPTKSSSKAKKICTMNAEDAQDCSSLLFEPNEEMTTYLQKNQNRNLLLKVDTKSKNSSKPKDKAESKKGKTKEEDKKSRGATIKKAQKTNPPSPKRRNPTPQRTKTPKKSATKSDGESTVSPKKNTSVKSSSPTMSRVTQSERHKIYREKKRQYLEDVEKEVESLRKENKTLKTTLKVNNLEQNMNGDGSVSDKGKDKVENKHQETSLFIQDLKQEIQQLQREKENLISVEDMESIADDFREEVSQLKSQKKGLEVKEKETDLLVCDLRQEIEGLKKQNEELEIMRNNTSIDVISALEKERDEMKSKAREMELFIDDLKKDGKDLADEKEECTRNNKEMNLLIMKLKEEIKTLNKNKDDLVTDEKEMELNVKDLREKLEGLKKQNDDHENNARETESIIRHLRKELGTLKTEKAVGEDNATEMEATISSLKREISELKKEKKEQETNIENMEKEKVSYQSNVKDMESVIFTLKDDISVLEEEKKIHDSNVKDMESVICTLKDDISVLEEGKKTHDRNVKDMESVICTLKDDISMLEEEKKTHDRNVKDMECMINILNDEISSFKTEKQDQEKKWKEMDTLIKDLTNENIELKKEKHNNDSSAQELEEEFGQLNTNEESISFLGEESPLSKNVDDGRDISSVTEQNYKEELEQLQKEKEELKQNAGKMDTILQGMKNELDQLKNEKEKCKKSSEEMVTVVQSMKEDLNKLKYQEKDDVQERESRKEKGHCLTAEDMSYFVKDLKDEIGYLKGLIINQSELSALVKHVGSFPGFEQSAGGKRKLDCANDDTGNENKRPRSGNDVSTVKPAGVCLHVNNGKMSVEFCSTCSKKSTSELNR